ncbi:MAG: MFS transporter [Bryobacteraceae bacterium]|jgi:AAHS family 4-hydroxybenzoate transporter-like MFS transporter
MSQRVDVAALMDGGSWSTYQKLLTALAALAVIFDGFDIQILGFAIPSLIREWHVVRADFGPVLAVGLAGMALGSPLAGYCGDRFGRRVTLIGCVLTFGLATMATAFLHGIAGLTVLRLVTGMGAGGALPNASALTAEFAPLRRRAVAVKLAIVCVPLGGMLGGLIAARVLPAFGWRALYAIGGALPLLFAVALWAALPESPRFLARRPERWPQLARLLARMGHVVSAGAEFEERQAMALPRIRVRTLFGPGLARDTAGLWIAFFFCLASIYLVFGWLPAMLTAQGVDMATASSGLAIYNFGGVLGVLVWAVLITILGSRRPLLSGALACAASALALLLAPIQAHGDRTWLLVGLGVNGLLANAVQTSMYALAAHVYPTSIRATGVAYSTAIGRVGGLLSSLFGAAIIQAGTAAYWYALAMAMICAFAGLAWVRSHYPAMGKLETMGATV